MLMMGILKKAALMFIANGAGLYIAARFIPGVTIPLTLEGFVLVVFALTLINFFIRPFVKFVLTPIIILTLGLGSLIVNALMLYFLDFLLPTVTIEGLVALALVTLIVSISSLVIHFSAKII